MEFLKNRETVICGFMVILAGCLSIAGMLLGLKVTAVNGVVAAIGLFLLVAIAFKEEN